MLRMRFYLTRSQLNSGVIHQQRSGCLRNGHSSHYEVALVGEVVELRTRHAIGLPDGPQQDMPLRIFSCSRRSRVAPPYSFGSPLAVKIAAIRGTKTLNRRRAGGLGA